MRKTLFFIIPLFSVLSLNLYSQTQDAPSNGAAEQLQTDQRKLGDAYYSDPFSEIETTEDEEYEEAIDRFYTFGRILHLAIHGNFVFPRGPMTDVYASGAMGGLRISYFIDWDVAITFQFGLGKLSVEIPNMNAATAGLVAPLTGGATMGNLGLGLRYYLNFNDISKPIAYINPAISAGVEVSIIRDYIDQGVLDILEGRGYTTDPSHRFIAPGLFFGISFEMPIFRKSIYIGADFTYHLSFFPSYDSDVDAADPHFGWIDYSGHYMTLGGSLIWNI